MESSFLLVWKARSLNFIISFRIFLVGFSREVLLSINLMFSSSICDGLVLKSVFFFLLILQKLF